MTAESVLSKRSVLTVALFLHLIRFYKFHLFADTFLCSFCEFDWHLVNEIDSLVYFCLRLVWCYSKWTSLFKNFVYNKMLGEWQLIYYINASQQFPPVGLSRLVGSVIKAHAISVEVWGSIPGSLESAQCRQRLAIFAMFLQSYAAEMDPATRYTLGRNNASIMKIWFNLLRPT